MVIKKFIPVFLVSLVSCVPWNVAPDCKIETPENGSEYSRGDSILVYVNANDNDGEIDEVRLYLDGIGISSMTIFPYSYLLETAELELGTHYLKAEAFDDSRKDDQSEVSFVINTGLPIVTTLQPVLISYSDLTVGGTITNDGGGTITVAGIVWSNEPYDVYEGNEVIAEVKNNSFTVALEDLDHSIYYIAAFAENERGRAFGEIVGYSIPAPPICEIIEPEDGSAFIRGDSIDILVNASDEDGVIRIVRAYVDSKPIAARENFPYAFVYVTTELSIGMHTLKVEAEDNSGIRSEDAINFTINTGK